MVKLNCSLIFIQVGIEILNFKQLFCLSNTVTVYLLTMVTRTESINIWKVSLRSFSEKFSRGFSYVFLSSQLT